MIALMSFGVLLLAYGSDGLQLGSAKGSACLARNPNGYGYVEGVCVHTFQCTETLRGLVRLQFPEICGTYLLVPLVCCPKMDQSRPGFLNPLGFGSHGTGSSYPYGQGAMNRGQQGFNPLGIVDTLLKNIPGTGGNFGIDIPNIVNPVPGIPQFPSFGDVNSFWKQIPPIPTGPFGGSFIPPIFGGGMQPAGSGFGNRGPQFPSGGGLIPPVVGSDGGVFPQVPGTGGGGVFPHVPGTGGGGAFPQVPGTGGGGVIPQVPGTGGGGGGGVLPQGPGTGGGGNQGPTYPQQPNPAPGTGPYVPPVHQGPNVPPVSPGGNVPSRPDVPIGGGPDTADISEEPCVSRDGGDTECRPATHCPHSERQPGLCTGNTALVCCSRERGNISPPPMSVPVRKQQNGLNEAELLEENWQLCGKHAPAIPFAVNYVASGRTNEDLGKYPFAVAVFRDNFHVLNFWCGGVLITRNTVLSAAHCFYGAPESTDFLLRVGSLNIANDDDSKRIIRRKVASIHIHPEYEDGQHHADLAVLTLDEPINVSPTSAHLPCLPEESSAPRVSTVTMLGWGDSVSEGRVLTQLHEAEVDTVSNADCNRAYQSLPTYQTEFPQGIDDKFICTAKVTASSCHEDSGGPLLRKLDLGKRTVFEIVGVVSNGVECGTSDHPGVYTEVVSFVPWILQTSLNVSQHNVVGTDDASV
ncbi:uncharacterized protein LOC135393931 isoform X2 [Ornithodoros turicata]|uniref:uncharacterized protein LOC135393931 isoform X2 n=1 Tax=Ornithodoros turicata TaxID=34597 RepID=UPI003138F1B2